MQSPEVGSAEFDSAARERRNHTIVQQWLQDLSTNYELTGDRRDALAKRLGELASADLVYQEQTSERQVAARGRYIELAQQLQAAVTAQAAEQEISRLSNLTKEARRQHLALVRGTPFTIERAIALAEVGLSEPEIKKGRERSADRLRTNSAAIPVAMTEQQDTVGEADSVPSEKIRNDWQVWVERAIVEREFDDRQAIAARAILREMLQRAYDRNSSFRASLTQRVVVEGLCDEAGPKQADIDSSSSPDLFEELVRRIDGICRSDQIPLAAPTTQSSRTGGQIHP